MRLLKQMSFPSPKEEASLLLYIVPKEDGSLLDLLNWRPITLFNVDCKIVTKAIAKRIEASLPKLINSDQTDFIKGCYVGENIRLVIDIVEYTKSQHSKHSSVSRLQRSS